MRFRAVFVSIVISLLLSSCMSTEFLGVEQLMRAPSLSEEQKNIYDALNFSLGSRNFILRYPKTGTHLSAFVLFDLNNDGRDEAIAFYSWNSEPDWVNINILENSGGSWVSIYDTPGQGAEIVQVDFVNIESTQRNDILIGWESPAVGDKRIGVYSFDGERLETLYTSNYAELLVSDVTYDGREDIFVVTPDTQSRHSTVKLVSYSGGEVKSIASAELTAGIASFEQVALNRLRDGTAALFLDYYGPEGLLATHIVTIEQGTLKTLLYDDEEDIDRTVETIRFEHILSQDINGDGFFEVPTQTPLPGYDLSDDIPDLYLTDFLQFGLEGEPSVIMYAIVNKQSGYMVRLREEWIGKLSAVNQMQTHEYVFFEYEKSLDDYSKTLFKIRFFSARDYQDIFVQETYTKIISKGLFDYYMFIPPPADEQVYSLSYAELGTLFSLI